MRCGDGPFGESEPVDFRVVAYIDGEPRMEKYFSYFRRERLLDGEFAEFVRDSIFVRGDVTRRQLHRERRFLLSTWAEPDQRAAGNGGMTAKHALARFGVEHSGGGFDAL